MSKYCSACGNELREGMKFCDKCGKAVDMESKLTGIVTPRQKKPQKKEMHTHLIIIAVIISIIAGIAGVVNIGGGYRNPFTYAERGINNCDASELMKAFPPSMWEDYELTDNDMDNEFGRDSVVIQFEIVEKEKMSDEDLEYYKEQYDHVKEGCIVTVNMSITKTVDKYYSTARRETETSTEMAQLIKIKGKWYFTDEVW